MSVLDESNDLYQKLNKICQKFLREDPSKENFLKLHVATQRLYTDYCSRALILSDGELSNELDYVRGVIEWNVSEKDVLLKKLLGELALKKESSNEDT